MGDLVLIWVALVYLFLVEGEYETFAIFHVLPLARPWHLGKASEHFLGP